MQQPDIGSQVCIPLRFLNLNTGKRNDPCGLCIEVHIAWQAFLFVCLLFTHMLQPTSKHSQRQVKAIYLKELSSIHVTSPQLDWHLTSLSKAAWTVSVTVTVRATTDRWALMWTDLVSEQRTEFQRQQSCSFFISIMNHCLGSSYCCSNDSLLCRLAVA